MRRLTERKRNGGAPEPRASTGGQLRNRTGGATGAAERPRMTTAEASKIAADCMRDGLAAARAWDVERLATTSRGVDGRVYKGVGRGGDAGGAGAKRPGPAGDERGRGRL